MAVDILGLITLPNWLCGVIALLLAVCLYTWYKQSLFHRLGIPTKKTMFLLGDFVDMIKGGFSYLGMDLYARYGKLFGIYLGNVPTLVISDPEIIKHIMVKDFDHFTDRPVAISEVNQVLKSAVSVADGDVWRNIRHTISPTFTSGKMRNMTPYLKRSLDVFHDILERKITDNPEGFDIDPAVRCYTMDVICATGFGLEVSAQNNPDNPFIKYSKRFLETNPLGMPKFILYILFPDLADKFPRLFETSFMSKDIIDFFMTATRSLFEDRKKSESNHKDLLQLMVNASKLAETEQASDGQRKGMTDEEILINSIIFMLAGYDTTAAGIAWVLYELALNPEIQQKLVKAIDEEIGESPLSYDNVFAMKYMDMVLSETLRVHSPATRLSRMPDRDTEIAGIKIPKGMNCTFVTDILHFLDEYWEDPYNFNPERFAPENKDKINEYAYLPFGVGPRNCVGMRLAQLEVKMTVISVLRKYRVCKGIELKVPLQRSPYGLARPGAPVHLRFELRDRKT